MLTTSFTCASPEETLQLGELVGRLSQPNDVWRLVGPLGAGKTLFVQGLAKGLEVKAPVTSPTFTLQNLYEGRLPLFHFDWYRLENEREVRDLDFREWSERGGVTAVEWGDKYPGLFPPETLQLALEVLADGARRVTVEASDPKSLPRVEELVRCWPP